MKFTLTTAALVGAAVAAPAAQLEARQMTANDVGRGQCGSVAFVYARGSTEPGNMGFSLGPGVCEGLKKTFPGETVCQGVGGAYGARIMDNVNGRGTSVAAIREGTKAFTDVFEKCPSARVVSGGYSQGSALMMNVIKDLPPNQRNLVLGSVFFGYTKNQQLRGQVPGYPADRLKVFCDRGDGVCGGLLLVNMGHFAYFLNGDIGKAVDFLASKINAAGTAGPAAAAPVSSGSGLLGGLRGGSGAGSGSAAAAPAPVAPVAPAAPVAGTTGVTAAAPVAPVAGTTGVTAAAPAAPVAGTTGTTDMSGMDMSGMDMSTGM
ncbi:carbohydrate esterase family 5 protein [Aulographum hederae CBS 113979]|uniref:Cutinase n=1 Tax=Aulographum hederae CBS 113979 TaxID=1176131 RepID=A0A6G1H8D5_9PEZI|nr:carbohydrate esterase family 5 protein [Aulographum hederae CBS 113979]